MQYYKLEIYYHILLSFFCSKIQTKTTINTVFLMSPWSPLLFAAAAAKSLQSCPTLCDPTEGSPPGSSVPGILQVRILEWVDISFANACMHARSLHLCLTWSYSMDSSPPGSSVHGVL